MKRPEWLFVGTLVLIGAYFVFKYLTRKEAFDSWDLVPPNAICVYETSRPVAVADKILQRPYWRDLFDVDVVKLSSDVIKKADTLLSPKLTIQKFLRKKHCLMSIHQISKTKFGVVFYLPYSPGEIDGLESALGKLAESYKTTQAQRTYQDVMIREIKLPSSTLGIIHYEHVLVLSTTGFLLEDVIRNIKSGFQHTFLSVHPALKSDPSLKTDEGNLFFNGDHWKELAEVFVGPGNGKLIPITQTAFFDLSLSDDDMLLSGFMYPGTSSLINTFSDQDPVKSDLISLVPTNALSCFEMTSEDLNKWYYNYLSIHPFGLDDSLIEKGKSIMVNATKSIGIVDMGEQNGQEAGKMILIEIKDKAGMLNQLNRLAEDAAQAKGDSVYYENYANVKIGLIDENDLPAKLFGSLFSGFKETYFIMYRKYMVLGTSAELLKEWLQSIDEDELWGRSSQFNAFREANLSNANLTYVVNINRSSRKISKSLSPKWKTWWQLNSQPLKQWNFIAFQVANLDNHYYTNLSVSYHPRKIDVGAQPLKDELVVQFDNSLIRKPKVVKNYLDGSSEILVQDSTYHLILVNGKGETLWTDTLSDVIRSEIYQIDYYQNKKLQYLFSTSNLIYLIDRHGEMVQYYKPEPRIDSIKSLHVIDYDRSRNYRFLLTDYHGNVYLTDKTGKSLDGWSPLSLSSTLSNDLFHVRVRGKDRIIIPEQNGMVNVLNRRAEQQDGFPLDLDHNFTSDLFFKSGPDFSRVRFVSVSRSGLKEKFDLNGKMYAKDQFYQPSGTTTFDLLPRYDGQDYVIVRRDLNRLGVLDDQGNELFEKDYMGGGFRDVQYYSFGPEKDMFVVRSTTSGEVQLYEADGTLINADPLTSDFPLSVIYHEALQKVSIYLAHSHTFEIKSFTF